MRPRGRPPQPQVAAIESTGSVLHLVRIAVGFLGAGIYEELLFRLILLSWLAGLLRLCGIGPGRALAVAVVASSLIFSTAHYVVPGGDKLQWFSFVFRFLAGAFFAILYIYRGFGIAVGAHAGYDLLVGLY